MNATESPAQTGEVRLPRLEATKVLHSEIILHLADAQAWLDRPEEERKGETPPRLAIAGEAGLGKTEAILAALSRPEWRTKRVLYLVPSLDLGEELAERARAKGITARVIRGRSQPLPGRPAGSDARMCAKADVAEGVASLGYNVTETLCSGPGPDGKRVECPFRASCPYMLQLADKKAPGLLIGAHAYLPLRMELLAEDSIDLVVIDETFWQSLVRESKVNIDRFRTWRPAGKKGYGPKKGEARETASRRQDEDTADFAAVHERAVRVIDRAVKEGRQPTVAEFVAEGVSSGDCKFAAGIELTHLARPDLHPAMPEDEQRKALEKAIVREAFGHARFWKILGREIDAGREGEAHGLVMRIGALNVRSQELENSIGLHYSAEPRFQHVPLLIIDADADPLVTERFYPGARFVRIAAEWRNVTIRQVTDRTGSAAAFANPANQDRAFNVALSLLDRHAETVAADPAARPLVVCQKAVEDAWTEAGRATVTTGPDGRARTVATAGFDIEHFGNVRGKDGWKHAAGLVIVGRIEPPPYEIERLARSVFYADAPPLAYLLPDRETGRIQLPKRPVKLRSRAGQAATVEVSYHPEDRADRLLRQVREAELGQALARVRPIHRGADMPCEIVVLTNVPLAIEPDRLVSWNEIVPDRHAVMRLRGFVPDVASDCAVAHPDLWDSSEAVRQAASRARRAAPAKCDGAYIDIPYGDRHTFAGLSRVTYSLEGNRRRRGAWVRLAPGETAPAAELRLSALLEGLYALEIAPALPEPANGPEAVQAAEEAAQAVAVMVLDLHASGDWVWWHPVARRSARPSPRWSRPVPPDRDPA